MPSTGLQIYLRCTNCGQIEPVTNWRPLAKGVECSHCSVKTHNECWPKPEILKILEFCESFDSRSPQYVRIISILLSVAFELMLEELVYVEIDSLGYWDDKQTIVIESLMNAYQGRSRLLQLSKQLGYSELPRKADDRRQKDFFQRWRALADMRNKAVHGELKKNHRIPPQSVRKLIREALFVFSRFHNLYNQESFDYEFAKKPVG